VIMQHSFDILNCGGIVFETDDSLFVTIPSRLFVRWCERTIASHNKKASEPLPPS